MAVSPEQCLCPAAICPAGPCSAASAFQSLSEQVPSLGFSETEDNKESFKGHASMWPRPTAAPGLCADQPPTVVPMFFIALWARGGQGRVPFLSTTQLGSLGIPPLGFNCSGPICSQTRRYELLCSGSPWGNRKPLEVSHLLHGLQLAWWLAGWVDRQMGR